MCNGYEKGCLSIEKFERMIDEEGMNKKLIEK